MQELLNMIAEMSWFMNHKPDCMVYTEPDADVCDCRVCDVQRKARALYNRYKKQPDVATSEEVGV